MSKTGEARLRFLNESAHLLVNSSPSTAAFLQSQVDQLATGGISFDPSLPPSTPVLSLPETRHLEVCASCGFDMASIPLILEPRKKAKVNSKMEQPTQDSISELYVECRSCGARASHEVTRPKLDRKRLRVRDDRDGRDSKTFSILDPKVNMPKTSEAATASHMASNSTPANPRKRPKYRKGNSLSAMLAKSKADAQSSKTGFGFDLMDLMKST